VPDKGSNIKSFIPASWFLINSASGDFDRDGYKDYVLVLNDSINEIVIGEKNRSAIILKGLKRDF
jgi:hypothetical protein